MRYSKTRIIATTIISISCFILVIFALYKGVEFAKKANGTDETTVKASVTEKKKTKKKVDKVVKSIKKKISKTTKKSTKKVKKKVKKKTTTKKVVKTVTTKKTETKEEKKTTAEEKKTETTKKEEAKEQETPKQEIQKEEKKEGPTFNKVIIGKYVVEELTMDGKEYTKKEINKLIKEGNSMNLEIDESGLATLHVLSINHFYVVDNMYFNEGKNKVSYSHSNTRIRITVDGAKMLFIKK